MPSGRVRIPATRWPTFWPSSMPPPPGLAPWPSTISIASAARRSSGLNPYRDGRHWYTSVLDAARSSAVIPPSPVVVDVPTSVAARPSASLAAADSAPNDIPAMVTGMSSTTGWLACRVPSTVRVSQRSR